MNKTLSLILFLFVLLLIMSMGFLIPSSPQSNPDSRPIVQNVLDPAKEHAFARMDLQTNTATRSIPLKEILSGGPGKDGIPALTNPSFVTQEEADKFVPTDTTGILIEINEDARFYPYNILVWHEIVNDVIDDTPVLVTFCPLCGTAIVFNPLIDDAMHTFGVSGLLYESNLLMYDHASESLWSQAMGEAVVGDQTGTTLKHLPFQLLSYAEVKQNHPNALVLSDNTGFRRDYDRYPYDDYDTNDTFYFPINNSDRRLPSKELIYAISVGPLPLALQISELTKNTVTLIPVADTTLEITKKGGEIIVKDTTTNTRIPGYYSMWFSWATHHKDSGLLWPQETSGAE